MRVSTFFRQNIVHEPIVTWDDYMGRTYAAPAVIRARWADEEHAVRSAAGVDIVSRSVLSTLTQLQEGDRVTDPNGELRTITTVREARGTGGVVSHYVGLIE